MSLAFLCMIGLLNVGYLSMKTLQVLSGYKQRSPTAIRSFLKIHIPPSSKVVADPIFYYAILLNQSDMQYINLYDTLPLREYKQRIAYDYDYLIISEKLLQSNPAVIRYYLNHATFDTVATYRPHVTQLNLWLNTFGFVARTEEVGYTCTILKRKKPSK